MLAVAAVGIISKLFLRLGCSEVNVQGLPILLEALKEKNGNGRGIMTVCNHISVWDDPLVWGILPWQAYFSSRSTRWTLGASDIMFTNKLFSAFFRKGQVIETFRGSGIYQSALNDTIEKLNHGSWVHIFPEGKVNQAKHATPPGELLRFKWGAGHLMMRAQQPPLVIPMWISGLDEVMHEDRKFPRFVPKFGQKVGITFGSPHSITDEVVAIMDKWRNTGAHDQDWHAHLLRGSFPQGLEQTTAPPFANSLEIPETIATRIALTDVLQQAVAKLGKEAEA